MIPDALQNILSRQGFVMLDGGLATGLEEHGANLDDPLWSAKMLIEAPELVRQVHAEFLKAGADVIATATYQASLEGFAKRGYSKEQAERLMRLSVDLAVLARESFWSEQSHWHLRQKPLVAASIGPYGATLHDGSEYRGDYPLSKQQLIDFHRPRMAILADTESDLFAFETIPSKLEAEALVELLAEFPEHTAWLSFSCKDGESTSKGDRFSECIEWLAGCDQIVAAGVNCSAPAHVIELLDSVEAPGFPLVVYPNSGERWLADDHAWNGEPCETLPVRDWYASGARVMGGCCRVSAKSINRMRDEIASLAPGDGHS